MSLHPRPSPPQAGRNLTPKYRGSSAENLCDQDPREWMEASGTPAIASRFPPPTPPLGNAAWAQTQRRRPFSQKRRLFREISEQFKTEGVEMKTILQPWPLPRGCRKKQLCSLAKLLEPWSRNSQARDLHPQLQQPDSHTPHPSWAGVTSLRQGSCDGMRSTKVGLGTNSVQCCTHSHPLDPSICPTRCYPISHPGKLRL